MSQGAWASMLSEDAGDRASNRNIGIGSRGSESHGRVWPVFIRLRGGSTCYAVSGPQGQRSPQGKVQLRRADTGLAGHLLLTG